MNTSPFANGSNSYRIYNSQGQFRGNLNTNQFDPNSVANPYGRYGNPYSPTSPNNLHWEQLVEKANEEFAVRAARLLKWI
jgi:hypothetical protein